MIDLGEVDINIYRGLKASEVLENPENHHWKLSFYFPSSHRNKYATPNGKPYGSSASFAKIYASLGEDFIGEYFENDYYDSDVRLYGDTLLREVNKDLGISIYTYITEKGNIEKFDSNINLAEKRYVNSELRLEEARERYSSAMSALDRAKEIYDSTRSEFEYYQNEMEDITDSIPLTKRGNYDKRTRGYHRLSSLQSYADSAYENMKSAREEAEEAEKEYDEAYSSLDRAERSTQRENTRLRNAKERKQDAISRLEYLKDNIADMRSKYEEASSIFAEKVKDDIIYRGQCGLLPVQDLPLKEATILRRLYAGIDSYPRFWATGQLIQSIRIKCTLV